MEGDNGGGDWRTHVHVLGRRRVVAKTSISGQIYYLYHKQNCKF
ncbi:hypothetical protein ACP70R_022288 [Stipagrostis hirtigluma subsp. patula]